MERKLKKGVALNLKNRGMSLEVDLPYPKELHENHSDFLLAPENYKVTYKELSPLNKFSYNNMKQNDSCHNCSEEKLIPTFHDRKKYILHFKCWIFYL